MSAAGVLAQIKAVPLNNANNHSLLHCQSSWLEKKRETIEFSLSILDAAVKTYFTLRVETQALVIDTNIWCVFSLK